MGAKKLAAREEGAMPKIVAQTTIWLMVAMAFGCGIFVHHVTEEHLLWHACVFVFGCLLVMLGAVHGSALGVYLWWRLGRVRRDAPDSAPST
jgi:hypothetical protein